MSLEGHIENGRVVFDEPVAFPDGTPVRVEVLDANGARPARPALGLGKGGILYIAPDFDETPAEFEEDSE